jgi:replicative DNA helicase
VLALAQLNRQAAKGAEPDLSDLRDSGAIEQDADTVLFLHPRERQGDGSLLVAALIAKNRQGRRGRFALSFYGATQRWDQTTADVSPPGHQR